MSGFQGVRDRRNLVKYSELSDLERVSYLPVPETSGGIPRDTTKINYVDLDLDKYVPLQELATGSRDVPDIDSDIHWYYGNVEKKLKKVSANDPNTAGTA
jgi:hypothetical protein